MADDRLWGMLITDGHHLPAEFVKVALRVKGLDRIIVTSDASPIAGLPPGRYTWMGIDLVSEPGISGTICARHCTNIHRFTIRENDALPTDQDPRLAIGHLA